MCFGKVLSQRMGGKKMDTEYKQKKPTASRRYLSIAQSTPIELWLGSRRDTWHPRVTLNGY